MLVERYQRANLEAIPDTNNNQNYYGHYYNYNVGNSNLKVPLMVQQ